MFRKLAIAAVTACALSSAQAATYDFGPHAGIELSVAVGAGFVPGGGVSFEDFFTFSITGPSTLTSTVVSLNQAPALGITGGIYALLTAGPDADFTTLADNVLVSPVFSYDGTTGSTPNAVVLGSGTFAYGVRGTTSGSGGLYALVSTVTPVPEPETLSLMLAGAGLLGFMAKRRRKA